MVNMSVAFQIKKVDGDTVTLIPMIDNKTPIIVGQKFLYRGNEYGVVKEIVQFSIGIEAVVKFEKKPPFVDLGDVVQLEY